MRPLIKLSAIIIFLFHASCNDLQSENTNSWNWGNNREKEQEQYVLLRDYVVIKEYGKAQKHLNWLLGENPKLNISLYKYGFIIYKNLINDCDDPGIKSQLKSEEKKLRESMKKNFPFVIIGS